MLDELDILYVPLQRLKNTPHHQKEYAIYEKLNELGAGIFYLGDRDLIAGFNTRDEAKRAQEYLGKHSVESFVCNGRDYYIRPAVVKTSLPSAVCTKEKNNLEENYKIKIINHPISNGSVLHEFENLLEAKIWCHFLEKYGTNYDLELPYK